MDPIAQRLARIERGEDGLEARILAGQELARLGDPRATALDLVPIPEGPFVHHRKREPDAGTARPREDAQTLWISGFSIDRYPVTVAAFAAFIDAGGYSAPRFWSRQGNLWRRENAVVSPRFWAEAEWAAYLVPNHPLVGVSYYEAEAFAAWRGARLPREAEWEKACAGPRGCQHPWGDELGEDRAAMRSVGPRGTVPIGTFPRGRSGYGVSDLVGCVWQWCADAVDEDAEWDDEDPFVDPERYADETPRVTRGGAWNTLPWSICCTAMNGYPPVARFSNLGFRCVVDAPEGDT
jgi:iron(II)-dependent oxidoreductase